MEHIMLDYIGTLLKKERPDFISDMRTVSEGPLTAATIKYAKDGKYFVANTYFTDSWVSATPYPKPGQVVRELSDVCDIKEFKTRTLMESYPIVTKQDLRDFYMGLQIAATKSLKHLFAENEYGDLVKATVQLSPILSVLVSVWNGEDFIGSILVFPDGCAKVAFAVEERMYQYAASCGQCRGASDSVPQIELQGGAE